MTSAIWCRLFGHRCRYVEGEAAPVRAECVRRTCGYEQELTDEWAEEQPLIQDGDTTTDANADQKPSDLVTSVRKITVGALFLLPGWIALFPYWQQRTPPVEGSIPDIFWYTIDGTIGLYPWLLQNPFNLFLSLPSILFIMRLILYGSPFITPDNGDVADQ